MPIVPLLNDLFNAQIYDLVLTRESFSEQFPIDYLILYLPFIIPLSSYLSLTLSEIQVLLQVFQHQLIIYYWILLHYLYQVLFFQQLHL